MDVTSTERLNLVDLTLADLTRRTTMNASTGSRAAVLLVGAAGVAMLGSGTAYAFWSTSGTGMGTAAATTAQSISAAPATIAMGLYPGAKGVAGIVNVSNPNPFPVTVTAASFAAPTATGGLGTCTTTGVTFTIGTLPITVPAKSGSTHGTQALKFTVAMDNTAQNGCQGATFTSNVSLTGTS